MRARDQLALVVRRADELGATTCLRHSDKWGFRMDYEKSSGTRFSVTGPGPEELSVLLMRLRPFLLAKEPTFLYSVHNTCQRAIRSDELRGYLIEARAAWSRSQRKGFMSFKFNGKAYSPERITDLFINGWYFHTNEDKARELAQLTAGAAPITRHIFFDHLLEATRQVLYVSHVIQVALKNDLVDDIDKSEAA